MSDADLLALMTGKLNAQTVRASSLMTCSDVCYYILLTSYRLKKIQYHFVCFVHMFEMLFFLPSFIHSAFELLCYYYDSEDVIAALLGAFSLSSF